MRSVFTSQKTSIITDKLLSCNAVVLTFEPIHVNMFSTPIPYSFESWLYRGGKKTISEQGAIND